MRIEKLMVGPFQTNCYILANEGNIIVIDPGSGARKIAERIEALGGKLCAILLTHGHFDHIGAVDALVKKYGCKVYASEDDLKMMRNEQYNCLGPYSASISCDLEFLEGDSLAIENFEIKVLYTPGHSNGSVMYIIENNLFSGDTLFNMGVGRTDLYSGSEGKLRQSLMVIDDLPDDMVVYPGHEMATTIGFEKANNPYLG